ncbi:MutS-related protein [Chitinophaga sp. 22321]|uniref:DNA mismatch repair protein n=1 Tax=Chitinophaga hostae TaxID=2831022 RepID=A0ABS5J9E7_9BACT|nr:DNA mismatch repair protein [Chitinophaga hostae]MBS0031834.1 DNA mismatch repair protein [Chitinophaga hostae]
MIFNTDKQTLTDLNILGKPGAESVYTIFNHTSTRGGAAILENMFRYPLAERAAINNRSSKIRFFQSVNAGFPFRSGLFDVIETYLAMQDDRTRLSMEENTLARKFNNLLAADNNFKAISDGIRSVIEMLHMLQGFLLHMAAISDNNPYQPEMEDMKEVLRYPALGPVLKEQANSKLSYAKVVEYDQLLRFRLRTELNRILSLIYHLDVYITVARVASQRKLVFPVALDAGSHHIRLEGVYHPQVKNAVANTIHITPENNIIFLTGANMAGKSTFMKSLGIAMFLAHMGFPVAAEKMEFAVREGIYTTINLPDDLSSGSSHFYTEVLRIKAIARELAKGKNLFLIFDELFRGTNVKDAYEGTVAVTAAFAERENCIFIISTHITEAGEALKAQCNNIHFIFLPTGMENNRPVYTYRLAEGVTTDRHGMVIINNEGILDIISKKKIKNKEA